MFYQDKKIMSNQILHTGPLKLRTQCSLFFGIAPQKSFHPTFFLFFFFFLLYLYLFLTFQDERFRRKRQVSKQQGQREEPTLQTGPEVRLKGSSLSLASHTTLPFFSFSPSCRSTTSVCKFDKGQGSHPGSVKIEQEAAPVRPRKRARRDKVRDVEADGEEEG